MTASDGQIRDLFGQQVAISNGTLAVGAPGHPYAASKSGPGAAYAFNASSGTWKQTAEMIAPGGVNGDGIGSSVAVSGTTIVAGAPDRKIGAAALQGALFVSGTGSGTISGYVRDEEGVKGLAGVKLDVVGTSDEHEAVSKAAKSDSSGHYSFDVPPGQYKVSASGEPDDQNGGTLAVGTPPAGIGSAGPVPSRVECSGTPGEGATCNLPPTKTGDEATASFSYTPCTSKERLPNGKPPSGCPIIFIPGFLGSRLSCSTGEVWSNIPPHSVTEDFSNPDFKDMALQSDGITNSGAPGSCAQTTEPLKGQDGVLGLVSGKDIYASALAYLNRIAPRRVYGYPYDWRKSPLRAVPELNHEVDSVLKTTKAARVVLMGHSMGGLVTQAYIDNREYADKVVRAITLGTPYWGAPKSHTALLSGKSDELTTEWLGLDFLINARSGTLTKAENYLQLAARNMQGLYWLYPSTNYGSWLTVKGEAFSAAPRGGSAIGPWVSALGGNPELVDSAVSGHSALDGFQTNGVDYQALIGIGTPTVTAMEIEYHPVEAIAGVEEQFGTGDGTVPARSASQGTFEGNAPLHDDVPISTACDVNHVALPGNPGVQRRIEGFLLRGEAVKAADNKSEEVCPYTGKQWHFFLLPSPSTPPKPRERPPVRWC